METACHFERSEQAAGLRFLAALEMTVPKPIDEVLCVTSVTLLSGIKFF
jgi:hypothetical protein